MSDREYRSEAERSLWWNLVDQCAERGAGHYGYVGIVCHQDGRRSVRRAACVIAWAVGLIVVLGLVLRIW